MRLLIANHTSEIVGGAERYIAAVVPALEQQGVSVRLLTETTAGAPEDRVVWHARAPGTRKQIEDWRPGVVFVHGLFDADLEAWLIDRFPGVLFAHNYYGTCISGEKRHRHPRLKFCERRFGRSCLALYFPRGCGPARVGGFVEGYTAQRRRHSLLDGYREILVASNHMKAEFERNTRTHVTLAPYFSAPPSPSPSRAREPNRFAFVGRMTSVKGGHLAIKACARLKGSVGKAITLDLVGDGPERLGWEHLARTCDVPANFHGWLGTEGRDEVLRRACALLLPSVWPEPFGLVGLEAARLGVPTVAFRAGGVTDWLEDDVTGALCLLEGNLAASLERGLLRARQDLTTKQTWGVEAHRRSQRFVVDNHVQLLLDVFARISGAAH